MPAISDTSCSISSAGPRSTSRTSPIPSGGKIHAAYRGGCHHDSSLPWWNRKTRNRAISTSTLSRRSACCTWPAVTHGSSRCRTPRDSLTRAASSCSRRLSDSTSVAPPAFPSGAGWPVESAACASRDRTASSWRTVSATLESRLCRVSKARSASVCWASPFPFKTQSADFRVAAMSSRRSRPSE